MTNCVWGLVQPLGQYTSRANLNQFHRSRRVLVGQINYKKVHSPSSPTFVVSKIFIFCTVIEIGPTEHWPKLFLKFYFLDKSIDFTAWSTEIWKMWNFQRTEVKNLATQCAKISKIRKWIVFRLASFTQKSVQNFTFLPNIYHLFSQKPMFCLESRISKTFLVQYSVEPY